MCARRWARPQSYSDNRLWPVLEVHLVPRAELLDKTEARKARG